MFIKLQAFGVCLDSIIDSYQSRISEIFNSIKNKTAKGIEMTGWIEWVNRDHSELIKKATKLREDWKKIGVNTVVVIGTGGSYIGCRAGLEFCNSIFSKSDFEFIFVPYFSERYLSEVLDLLKKPDVNFGIVVVSKSGTTLESAVGFRLLRELLFEKKGAEYKKYVVAITDKSKGVLRDLVEKNGFTSFVIEDDIGGRYSTLTSVGLVPMALGGIDISKVMEGAKQAYCEYFKESLRENSAALYASVRHHLFSSKNLVSECLCSYDPQLRFCMEKMKQLFAESEGKNNKGLMPIIMDFTPDLHSVGQLIQDGNKSFFMSTLTVEKPKYKLIFPSSSFGDDDNLDWLSGKHIKDINNCAFKGTLDAHSSLAKIPNIVINLACWNPESFGYFYYWISLSAMFSSYLFGVNPFDQPGVEAYKKRMLELLRQ